MGKTIIFQESDLSVPFPDTNRSFDLFLQFVKSDGLLLHMARPARKRSLFYPLPDHEGTVGGGNAGRN